MDCWTARGWPDLGRVLRVRRERGLELLAVRHCHLATDRAVMFTLPLPPVYFTGANSLESRVRQFLKTTVDYLHEMNRGSVKMTFSADGYRHQHPALLGGGHDRGGAGRVRVGPAARADLGAIGGDHLAGPAGSGANVIAMPHASSTIDTYSLLD